jgi:hypothetical protein
LGFAARWKRRHHGARKIILGAGGVKLYQELKDGGYNSSIGSTFNVDITFYDQIVQHRLQLVGCANNVLLVDANMWRQTVGAEVFTPKNIGRSYVLWPVDASSDGGTGYSCFHPKLFVQLGQKQGRLIVGSANMTLKGHAHNREILTKINWSHRDEGAEAEAARSLIRQAYDYLSGFLDRAVPSIEHKLTQMERDAPWLMETEPAQGVFDLDDGERVGLLFGRAQSGGIARRFADWTDNEQINRLTIVSPYWNEKLDAAHYLRDRFGSAETFFLVQPETVSFPASGDVVREFHPRELEVSENDASRFLHAKIIVAEGVQFDHVLIGSANCTFAALGSDGHHGLNHEACLYRRLPTGWAKRYLDLDADQYRPIDWDTLTQKLGPEDDLDDISSMPGLPGMVEKSGAHLMWWPSEKMDPTAAQCLILDDDGAIKHELKVGQLAHKGHVLFIVPDIQLSITMVKFRFSDGSVSSVAYVHDRDALRKTSRGSGGSNIQKAIDALRTGENDAIAFLDILHRLKSDDYSEIEISQNVSTRRTGQSAGTPTEEPADEPGPTDVKTYTVEEFLRGREQTTLTATGRSGILSAHDATFTDLLDMLRHVSFGHVVTVPLIGEPQKLDDSIYDDENSNPDDDEEPSNSGDVASQGVSNGNSEKRERPPNSDIPRAKEKLHKEVQSFSQRLRDEAKQDTIPYRLALEFWLHLIMLALGIRATDNQRVLSCEPKDEDGYYPRLVVTLLSYFYVHPAPSVFGKLELDRDQDIIPDDIFDLISMSAWSVCLSFAIDEGIGANSLVRYLTPVADQIYGVIKAASVAINADEMRGRISELNLQQKDLPVSPEEILLIHDRLMNVQHAGLNAR